MGLNQSVELHIDELLFEGFTPAEARRAGAALQEELARLIGERGLPPGLTGSRELERLDAGEIDLNHRPHPEIIGRQVAQRIYTRLSR